MTSKNFTRTLNPLKQAKRGISIAKDSLKGNLGSAGKKVVGGDSVFQLAKARYKFEEKNAKKTLSSETGTAAASLVAGYFGGPLAAGAVQAAGASRQAKEARKKAKIAGDALNKTFEGIGDSIEGLGEGEPQIQFGNALREQRKRRGRRASVLRGSRGIGLTTSGGADSVLG